MRPIISLLFVIFSSSVAAQEIPSPPAMSNLSKQRLIDEFIDISYYKEALINYAKEYVELKMIDYSVDPPKQNLSKEQVDTIIRGFNFDDFKISLYSSLSSISEENLKQMIRFHKSIDVPLSKNNSVLLMTPAIDLNIKNQMNYAIDHIK